jgi:hypothetical protein
MANRNLLHRNKLNDFIAWLGDRSLPTKGKWEVARWKGPKGQPMRIIFDNDRSCEHLSCNDAAYKDVRRFIKETKVPPTSM